MIGQVELFPEKFPWEETVPILVCREDTEGRRDGVLVKKGTEVCNVPRKRVPVDLQLAAGGLGACLLPAVTCSPPVSTEKTRQCRGPAPPPTPHHKQPQEADIASTAARSQ